jgi:uncharacterized protein
LEVDIARKRIALTMRLSDEVIARIDGAIAHRGGKTSRPKPDAVQQSGAMAAAFAKVNQS